MPETVRRPSKTRLAGTLYSEPSHVFSSSACQLTVKIDDDRYESNARWKTSAPYKTVTVRDTMSDLPHIKNGHDTVEIRYGGEARFPFLKMIRKGSEVLSDHVTKNMSPLSVARIALIPPNGDWRDLPNNIVRLKDGTSTKKIFYEYDGGDSFYYTGAGGRDLSGN